MTKGTEEAEATTDLLVVDGGPVLHQVSQKLKGYVDAFALQMPTLTYLLVVTGIPVIHQIIQKLRFPKAAHGCLADPSLLQQVGKLVASIRPRSCLQDLLGPRNLQEEERLSSKRNTMRYNLV